LRNCEYFSPTQRYATGGLVSTVTDLSKWDAALYTPKFRPNYGTGEHEQPSRT